MPHPVHLLTIPSGILVDISGTKFVAFPLLFPLLLTCSRYHARIEKVFPPKYSSNVDARDAIGKGEASSSALEEEGPPHTIGGDLSIPVKDSVAKDDPCSYFYWVTLLELERDPNNRRSKAPPPQKDDQMIGSVMEVQCGMMRYALSHYNFIFVYDTHATPAAIASRFPSPSFDASSVTASTAIPLSPPHGSSSPPSPRTTASPRTCPTRRAKA